MFVTTYAHLEATIIHRGSGLLTFVTEDYMFDFKAISHDDNPTLTLLVHPLRLYVKPDEDLEKAVEFYKGVLFRVKQLAHLYLQDRGCSNLVIRVYGSPITKPYQIALQARNYIVKTHAGSSWIWTGAE